MNCYTESLDTMLYLIVIVTVLFIVIALRHSRVLRNIDFLYPTKDGNCFQSSLHECFPDKPKYLLIKSGLYLMPAAEINIEGCSCRNVVNDQLIVRDLHNHIDFCDGIWICDCKGSSLPGGVSHSSVYIKNFKSFFLRCNKSILYCQHLYLEFQRSSIILVALVSLVMVKLHIIMFSDFVDTCCGVVDSISDQNLVTLKGLTFILKYINIDLDFILLCRHKSCVQSASLEDLIRILSFRWTKPFDKWLNSFISTDYFIYPVTSLPSRLNTFAPLLKKCNQSAKKHFSLAWQVLVLGLFRKIQTWFVKAVIRNGG
uniref:Uncharacterized protein n=1 Tax=Biomphalaria glabrata TaxID=6526 RepID=A0A2C9KTR6_BIOGL